MYSFLCVELLGRSVLATPSTIPSTRTDRSLGATAAALGGTTGLAAAADALGEGLVVALG